MADNALPIIDDACGNSRTRRWYRHPFLKNAETGQTNGVWDAPLKQWMRRFIDEYVLIQTQRDMIDFVGLDLPDPDFMYFDTESHICLPPERNPIVI